MKKALILIFIVLGIQTLNAQSETTLPGSETTPFRSPFRYVIVAGVSDLEKYVNRFDDSLSLEVLMEDRSFNERNLRQLFELISKRFPNQKLLSIDVYTTLDAIKTPEENDRSNLKGPIEDYKRFKYAFFYRRPNKCDRNTNFLFAEPGQPETNITLKCDKSGELIFD